MELATNNRVHVPWGDSSTMRRLFESDLQNLWNRSARGAALYKNADGEREIYRDAMQCYEQAIEFGTRAKEARRIQTKDLSRLYYNRGRAAVRCDEYSEALSCCNAALDLDPLYLSAMRMRASCHLHLFEFASACKDWEWVLERRAYVVCLM